MSFISFEFYKFKGPCRFECFSLFCSRLNFSHPKRQVPVQTFSSFFVRLDFLHLKSRESSRLYKIEREMWPLCPNGIVLAKVLAEKNFQSSIWHSGHCEWKLSKAFYCLRAVHFCDESCCNPLSVISHVLSRLSVSEIKRI